MNPIPIADGAQGTILFFLTIKTDVFLFFTWKLDKDCHWNSEPHLQGTIEFFTVAEGSVKIINDGEEFILNKGDGYQFRGDVPHSYQNIADCQSTAYNIMYNP